MKRVMTMTLLILVISCATFGKKIVAVGKTTATNGNFRIETADQPIVLEGVILDTYTITYDNSDLSIIVAIEKTKKCVRYLTLSDKLSVQYVCYGNYFGIEKLGKQYEKHGIATSDDFLNRAEYFHQKVIVSEPSDAIKCMKLIGAYFPDLLSKEKELISEGKVFLPVL